MLAALCVILVAPFGAEAKWNAAYGNAPEYIIKWYSGQNNGRGEWCCSEADAHAFYGDYTVLNNGDVQFNFEGRHYHLPAYMVLTGPNPTGHAVWWYVFRTDGAHVDYCFAPGAAE